MSENIFASVDSDTALEAALKAYRKEKARRVCGRYLEGCGAVVCEQPKRAALKRFTAEISGSDPDYMTAAENLVVDTVIHPDRSRMEAIFDEYPGLAMELSNDIQKLSTGGKTRSAR